MRGNISIQLGARSKEPIVTKALRVAKARPAICHDCGAGPRVRHCAHEHLNNNTMTHPISSGTNLGVHLQLLVVALVWAGQFIAGRIVAPLLPPLTAGALRFVAASAALLIMLRVLESGLPRLDAPHRKPIVALAIVGVAAWNYCFFAALETISAGRAALIMALNPIAVAVGATLFFGERRRALGWVGIALALLGAAVVITRGDPGSAFSGAFGIGDALMFGCVVGWAAYTLIGRPLFATLSPLAVTTWSALIGTAMLIVASAAEWHRVTLGSVGTAGWASLLYLGVLGTALNFYWFNRGVQRLGPSQAAIYINLVPVFAVLYATLFLAEPVLGSMVIGGLMVLGGVVLVTRRT